MSKRLSEYCFTNDTLVSLANGRIKFIGEIKENDIVLSANGVPTKVIKIFKHKINEEILEIKHTLNGFNLKTTYNHPILSTSREDGLCYYGSKCFIGNKKECDSCKRTIPKKVFIEAGDLRKGDFLYAPGIQLVGEYDEDINEDLAWILGLFVDRKSVV